MEYSKTTLEVIVELAIVFSALSLALVGQETGVFTSWYNYSPAIFYISALCLFILAVAVRSKIK